MFGYLHSYNSNKNRAGSDALKYYKAHPRGKFDTIYGEAP
jgi:hypothetical protein